MKITIELDEVLEHAIELHLSNGVPVYTYVKAAIVFFRDMYKQEEKGKTIGFGDSSRFKSYNTEASPKRYITGRQEEIL